MFRSVLWAWLVAVSLLVSPPALWAADREVGFGEALRLALEANPRLVAMESSLAAAREKAAAARGYLRPSLTVEERYMLTDNPTYAFSSKLNQGRFAAADFAIDSLNDPEAIGDFTTSLSFEQTLYSRQALVGVRMADTASRSSELEYRRAREQALLEVLEAFIAGQTARKYEDVARKGQIDAQTHLEITRTRVETGLGLESDLLRARVAVSEAEEREVSANKNVSLAARGLGLALGLDGPVSAGGETVPAPVLEPPAYYEEAAARRSDLLSMDQRVENARNNISMVTAPFAPVAGVGGSWQMNSHQAPFDEENSSYQAMAFVRWNLYSGGRRGHEKAQALHSLREAEAYRDGLKKEIIYRVNEAYLGVLEAQRGAQLSDSRLNLAKETTRLIEKRYQNSLATVVEIIDAQTALDSARANQVARNNSYLVSLARLMFQSGLIEQAYLEDQEGDNHDKE